MQRQLAQAQQDLDRALAESPSDPGRVAQAFGHLGQLYLLYDFMGPAADALERAHALAPDEPRWAYYLAIHHRYEGNLEQAVAALDKVVALLPDNLAAAIHRADLQLELGLLDQAETDYRRALDLHSTSSAAHLGLGRIDFERREIEAAVSRFETALAGQPQGSVVHHHLGLALRRLGRREEAAIHFEQNEHVSVRFPDPLFDSLQRLNASREAHVKRGTAAMRHNDPQAALAAFLDALEALPDDPSITLNIAMALIELGEKEAAEARLRQSIAIDPNYRDPQYNLALVLAERGDLEGAERHFRRAAEIDPDDVEARVRHADILTRLGRATEAVELLDQVLAVDPALPLARLALGAAHQTTGATDAARAALNKVLEAAPAAPKERAEAHYRLAVMAQTGLAERGALSGNLDEPPGQPGRDETSAPAEGDAVTHLESALALDDDFAEAGALLGRLLARQERYVEAAGHYARALARDPANADWHRDRAMALILGQRYAAARSSLIAGRRAVADPDLEVEPAVIDHLDMMLARLLAASPDPTVRDGREALAIARRLMSARPTIEHAETLAMAWAEVGDFARAAELQRNVLSEVSRRGAVPTAGQERRLAAYVDNEPIRAPWFAP